MAPLPLLYRAKYPGAAVEANEAHIWPGRGWAVARGERRGEPLREEEEEEEERAEEKERRRERRRIDRIIIMAE